MMIVLPLHCLEYHRCKFLREIAEQCLCAGSCHNRRSSSAKQRYPSSKPLFYPPRHHMSIPLLHHYKQLDLILTFLLVMEKQQDDR